MTDEERRRRQYNPKWKDNTRKERQRNRRSQLRGILAQYGWDSESKLHTAIINGVVEPPTKPKS